MEVPQKPYANITKSFVHLAAQICFMKNCWNPSSMSAATGACTRHYHPTLSIWLSVDPMADKYPSTSPYTYCADNPVRLVDPDGEDVWILANDIKTRNEAFNSLQSGTHLLLEMEDDGRIIIVGGGIYNDNDQQLANAINSSSVKCNIDANPNPIYSSGHYMGTEYDSDTKTAVSTNGIFLPGLQEYEKKGAEGSGIMHEITEGFQMGSLAIENKTSIPAAKWHYETNELTNTTIKEYDSPITNQLFPIGHGRATPDPCSMNQKQAKQFKQYQFEKYKPTIHFPIKLFP